MGLITLVKEFWRAFFFAFSLQFLRMALLWSFSLLFSYYQLLKPYLFSQKPVSYPRCSPSTSTFRPVCVVTGATSGLGLAAARELSKEGYVVVIVGRSRQLLSETIRKIKDWNEDAHLNDFLVDLSSIESIIKFKISLRDWLLDSDLHCSIQILINDAGILATSPRVTAEGYEQMIGTNYIGAFALTKLLLPLLESSPVSSKIVNVTSFTHRAVTDVQVDEETVSGKKFLKSMCSYPCAQIYEYSKLCLLLFSHELHRQLCVRGKSHQIFVTPWLLVFGESKWTQWLVCQPVPWVKFMHPGSVPGKAYEKEVKNVLNFLYKLYSHLSWILLRHLHSVSVLLHISVADPGVVQTNLMREVPAILTWLAFFVLKCLRLLQSPECGVDSIIDAALAPPGTSGAYFIGGKGRTINPSALSRNTKLARELWESTNNLLSVTPLGAEKDSW